MVARDIRATLIFFRDYNEQPQRLFIEVKAVILLDPTVRPPAQEHVNANTLRSGLEYAGTVNEFLQDDLRP